MFARIAMGTAGRAKPNLLSLGDLGNLGDLGGLQGALRVMRT